MTTHQLIDLWSCAQDVPRSEIEHLGPERELLIRMELGSGQYGEIWTDGHGKYYYCICEEGN